MPRRQPVWKSARVRNRLGHALLFPATTAPRILRHPVQLPQSNPRSRMATYAAPRNKDNRRRTCMTTRQANADRSVRIGSNCDTKPSLRS